MVEYFIHVKTALGVPTLSRYWKAVGQPERFIIGVKNIKQKLPPNIITRVIMLPPNTSHVRKCCLKQMVKLLMEKFPDKYPNLQTIAERFGYRSPP